MYLCTSRTIEPDVLRCNAARKAKDPDTFSWDEAMASPYKKEFLEAADREIEELDLKGTWVEDLIMNATVKATPCQWVFRIKRSADGEIRKWKARSALWPAATAAPPSFRQALSSLPFDPAKS